MRKTQNIYIHIGTHKTGTTSINRFLKDNSQNLKSQGYKIVKLSTKARESARQILALPNKSVEEHTNIFINNFLESIQESRSRVLFSEKPKLIMIWEGFSGNPNIGYQSTDKIAAALSAATARAKLNAKIILYIRRQDDFISSMYSQQVRMGSAISMDEFIGSLPADSFNWDKLTKTYENHFGPQNLVIERYGKNYMPSPKDLLSNFCDNLKIETSHLSFQLAEQANRSNTAWPRDFIEIARKINLSSSKIQKHKLRSALNHLCQTKPYSEFDFFSPSTKKAILCQHSESNKSLAERRFNSSQETLFDESDLHDVIPSKCILAKPHQNNPSQDNAILLDLARHLLEPGPS